MTAATATAAVRSPERTDVRPTPLAHRSGRAAARRPLPQRGGAGVDAALSLLDLARAGLGEAMAASVPTERYAAAHLAALRSAAAVLAVRGRPASRRRGPRSAWELVPQVAPELSEWAAFFAAGAAKRAAAEAGIARAVTCREADDLVRDSTTFLALVETTLGLLSHAPCPPRVVSSATS